MKTNIKTNFFSTLFTFEIENKLYKGYIDYYDDGTIIENNVLETKNLSDNAIDKILDTIEDTIKLNIKNENNKCVLEIDFDKEKIENIIKNDTYEEKEPVYEIIAVIDGTGQLNFYKVKEDEVEEFINEKSQAGYLVSVVTNGTITEFASGDNISFDIKEENE